MRRIKDYCKVIAWQTGLGYLLLWAVTFWTLDEGATFFGNSGVCLPDQAKVLFYWVCEASSPLSILASLSNVALTVTVWAPVYVAAATVDPDAMAIAVPIIAVHVIGLPLGMFVLVRMMATALDLRRRIPSRGRPQQTPSLYLAPTASPTVVAAGPATAALAPPAPVRAKPARPLVARSAAAVPPRNEFGLRSCKADNGKSTSSGGRRKA